MAPAALVDFLRSYPSAPIFLYVAQTLIGNMNKSGAFEVIDADTSTLGFRAVRWSCPQRTQPAHRHTHRANLYTGRL